MPDDPREPVSNPSDPQPPEPPPFEPDLDLIGDLERGQKEALEARIR
jgi:hypothetical protein